MATAETPHTPARRGPGTQTLALSAFAATLAIAGWLPVAMPGAHAEPGKGAEQRVTTLEAQVTSLQNSRSVQAGQSTALSNRVTADEAQLAAVASSPGSGFL